MSSTLRSCTAEMQGTNKPFSVSMAMPMLWSGYCRREDLSSLRLALRLGYPFKAMDVACARRKKIEDFDSNI